MSARTPYITPLSPSPEQVNALAGRAVRRFVLTQFGLFAIALALWPIPIFNPVKLIVVLFHELSHVLAAYLTGGVVFGMAIDPAGAGVTLGIDGIPLVIIAAGYCGSLLAGIVLNWLAVIWEPGEVWGVLVVMCCCSLAFNWLNNFTAVFGYGTLFLLLVGAAVLPSELKSVVLHWIATTSCLYPIIDVAGEVFAAGRDGFIINGRPALSDVSQLAQQTGIPLEVLASIWIFGAFGCVLATLLWSARRQGRELRHRLLKRDPRAEELDRYANPSQPPRHVIR